MTKRTQTEPAVCWLASEWTKSLGRVLDERTGQSLRVDRLEPMADAAPAGLEWWAQTPAGKTRPSLWIGAVADEFPELLAGAFEELAERSPAGPPPTAETVAVDLTIGLNSLRLYVAAQEDAMPESDTLALLLDLELPVSVSLGKVQMLFGEVLKLASGSIVELNRSVDDPVDIVVNEQVIASGEVVVVNGNYGVRIQSLASRAARMRSAGVTVGAF